MFAILETYIDQDSGERGSMCVYHCPNLEVANKVKGAFEKIELEGYSYRVTPIEPDADFDCPICGEGIELRKVG